MPGGFELLIHGLEIQEQEAVKNKDLNRLISLNQKRLIFMVQKLVYLTTKLSIKRSLKILDVWKIMQLSDSIHVRRQQDTSKL